MNRFRIALLASLFSITLTACPENSLPHSSSSGGTYAQQKVLARARSRSGRASS
ncbi:MAG: hypothetical protein HC933_09535 [Pleurocapsa sp. SU_196_0]|nr:hypothetical protein [Pleurocapsa sp. SU_196_0]